MGIPILGANSTSAVYEIDNSLRFNDGDSPRLSREFAQDPTSRTTFTFSAWIKKTSNSHSGTLMAAQTTSNFFSRIMFDSDTFRIENYSSGSRDILSRITHVLRDTSAWYHLVWAIDTTQADGNNGMKLYINGTQQSISISPYAQNATFEFGRNGTTTSIGRDEEGSYNHFDGYIADVNYIDGQQLDASYFGETSTDGIWFPKSYTGTYGNNGFFLEFQQTGTSANSSGMGADTSGNDEHFTPTNLAATDVTTDTPTNNFATLNAVAITNSNQNLSEGNTVHTVSSGAWIGAYSTLGFTSGKWYAELKVIADDNTSWGVIQSGGDTVENINNTNSGYIGKYADGWGWWGNASAKIINNNSDTNYGSQESVNDIFMIAVDVDGGKLWIGKNGTFFNAPGTSNAGDPAAGTNPGFSGITFTEFVHFASGLEAADNDDAAVGWNFGNAAHSISSGNADANGHGNFEYAVPSGFFALCTKNLAEFG